MLKTVELLGVRMNDNYVREIMGQVIQLEDRPGMSTLEIMTADLLLACQEHASWMEWYHQRDLVLPGDIALLEAEGRNVPGRRKELQERAFLRECRGSAQQRGKRVYRLAASPRNNPDRNRGARPLGFAPLCCDELFTGCAPPLSSPAGGQRPGGKPRRGFSEGQISEAEVGGRLRPRGGRKGRRWSGQ